MRVSVRSQYWFYASLFVFGTILWGGPILGQTPANPNVAILDISTPDAYFGVSLTDAQRTRLFAIRDRYAAQFKAIVVRAKGKKTSISRDSIRAELARLTEARQAEMLAVLTPAQRATAEATLAERRTYQEVRYREGQRQRDSVKRVFVRRVK